MADILQIGREYRKEILRLDNEAARDLVRYYGKSYADIEKSLDSLLTKIQDRRNKGERVSRSWLNDETRYRELLAQIRLQIDKFSEQAERTITKGQGAAVSLATDGAKDMIRAGVLESTVIASTGYTFHRVPKESLEYLVGYLGNGAPLGKLLGALGEDAASRAKDVLTNAVIKGLNPRQTARQMRDAFGGNLSRALTVARTEQLRSYRQASIDNYRANDDVVDGWTRIETLDDLTCLICIVECGKVYTNKDDFETHPNCRGTLVPNVKGAPAPNVPNGIEWFDKQPEDRQREILGDAKYEAYKKGEIDLPSLVQRTEHPNWGGGRRVRSLEDAKQEFANRSSEVDPGAPLYDSWEDYFKNERAEFDRIKDKLDEATPDPHQSNLARFLMEERGYNEKPVLLSSSEFQEIKTGRVLHKGSHETIREQQILYRGVTDTSQIDSFINGDSHFASKGAHGAGTYFTGSKEEAERYAFGEFQSYHATGKGTPGVLEIRLAGDARVATPEILDRVQTDLNRYVSTLPEILPRGEDKWKTIEALNGLLQDRGALAIALGYDALIAESGYTVLLNRGKALVNQASLKTKT